MFQFLWRLARDLWLEIFFATRVVNVWNNFGLSEDDINLDALSNCHSRKVSLNERSVKTGCLTYLSLNLTEFNHSYLEVIKHINSFSSQINYRTKLTAA